MMKPYGHHKLVGDGRRDDYSIPIADLGILAEQVVNKPHPDDASLICYRVELVTQDQTVPGNYVVHAFYQKGR